MNAKVRSSLLRRLLLPTLAVCAVLLSAPLVARAQDPGTITPIVECTTPDPRYDGFFIFYLGYRNDYDERVPLKAGTSRNYFIPGAINRGQPSYFESGERRAVFTTRFYPTADVPSITWKLNGKEVVLSADAPRCRSGRITYQGRLSANGAAATGNYDLQYQVFDKATGGTAITPVVPVTNVYVTNGVFTVPLDLGVSAFNSNGERHLEIGVRAAGSAGAYATLAPRQPLTDAPSAVFAGNAATAGNAVNALNLGGVPPFQYVQTDDARLSDPRNPYPGSGNYVQNTTAQQANTNFNISGSGTIGGNLTVNSGVVARGGAPGANGSNNNGYAFNGTGDNDSGLFSEGNGQVSLYTNAFERVRVTDSGLQVFGTLTANTKNFRIDHPLDPANKVLNYTSVESPDMMNIYNGNTTTDARGEAVVTMPAYFSALNRDFRYQLTVIGTFAQAIVAEEIAGNSFKIRTDKPEVKVSWQVTGIRHDKFAEDQRQPIEQYKPAAERGRCLYDPACRVTPNAATPNGKP